MSLTNCKDCGNEISTEASACPKCGRRVRRPVSLSRIVGLALLGMLVVGYLTVGRDYERKAGRAGCAASP